MGHGSDSVEELEKEIQIFDDLLKDVSDADHELFQLYSFTSPDCDTEYSSDFAWWNLLFLEYIVWKILRAFYMK